MQILQGGGIILFSGKDSAQVVVDIAFELGVFHLSGLRQGRKIALFGLAGGAPQKMDISLHFLSGGQIRGQFVQFGLFRYF